MAPQASKPFNYPKLRLESPNLNYVRDASGRSVAVESLYRYESVRVEPQMGPNEANALNEREQVVRATPVSSLVQFRTSLQVPRVGLMLVGWTGNNGSTLTGALLANKHKLSFETKEGVVEPNFFGSITQSATIELGGEHFVPMNRLLPMVEPSELVVDGWDIQGIDLAEAMEQARVLDIDLQRKLRPLMQRMRPRRALFDLNFVAANQQQRATNIIDPTLTKWQQVQHLINDIESFKRDNQLDKVIVLWTANTERFCEPLANCHDTADNLMRALRNNSAECAEISPSSLYALAAILTNSAYINGSPQNTFVPALIELAEQRRVFIGGDDFKSGQTKLKSVLVDFLVGAGIKPRSIVSYNHLGNNDGYNLSSPMQFRSKEISKSSVVDDMVASNKLLYGDAEHSKPDHCVVIKYVPFVGDSKRALDEYVSELMLGGRNTIVAHNTCEDSLLAAPLILDLVLITELCQRVRFRVCRPQVDGATSAHREVSHARGHNIDADDDEDDFQPFNSVLSMLAYLCKAPLVERGARVVNALFKQRACIENTLRALLALPPLNHMDLEHKCSRRDLWFEYPTRIDVDSELSASIAAPMDKTNRQQQQVDRVARKLAQIETIDANGNETRAANRVV